MQFVSQFVSWLNMHTVSVAAVIIHQTLHSFKRQNLVNHNLPLGFVWAPAAFCRGGCRNSWGAMPTPGPKPAINSFTVSENQLQTGFLHIIQFWYDSVCVLFFFFQTISDLNKVQWMVLNNVQLKCICTVMARRTYVVQQWSGFTLTFIHTPAHIHTRTHTQIKTRYLIQVTC
jgi:hypothetical protein